jgi:polyisoprenoid-binding protein YceI
VWKICAVAGLALLSTGCGAPKPRQTPAPAPLTAPSPLSAPTPTAPAARTERYHVDAAASELRVLVYRAGVMASLGHNHVIINRGLSGWVTLAAPRSATVFALTVPVADFVVDDSEARRAEGENFSETVADDAKSGTARNMLGPAVLDAADHPAVTVRSVTIAETPTGFEANVAIEAAGHESQLTVPFTLDRASGRLSATGELTVRQSALGLTPFSILLGALRVEDAIGLKFKIVAIAD